MTPAGWIRGHRTGVLAVAAALVLGGVAAGYVVTDDEVPRPDPLPRGESVDGGLWGEVDDASLSSGSAAYQAVRDAADDIPDGDDASLNERNDHNTSVLAAALLAHRGNDDTGRRRVRDAIVDVMDETERVDDVLSVARKLVGYVLAADLVDLASLDPATDQRFRDWLDDVRDAEGDDGRTLVSTHEDRPNNWGTHAGASRIAVALYLGDDEDLHRAADVFAGWLGDRDRYRGFEYGDTSWQCDPDRPVGINPAGCTIDGHPAGGVLPDDQRRGGDFTWPPPEENYVWEALQGAVVQAELLDRAGYDAWSWSDDALIRALDWLHTYPEYPAEGDDTWIPWLVNHATGSSFPTRSPTEPGKNVGWTDWTHAGVPS